MEDKRLFRECEVLSVKDDNAQLRIKVRLNPEDNYKKDSDLPYCFPLMPKHFQVNPKKGEMVLVVLSRLGAGDSKRFFIGPIIGQQYMLNADPFFNANMVTSYDNVSLPRPELNPENEGSIPDREDIAIQGRTNTDVVLKDNEVRIRCGFKKEPLAKKFENRLVFNKEDLAYIQMKYKRNKDSKSKTFYSSINIVADRINLLSHDSSTPFTLNDKKELITDNELKNILEKAHPLVYGDELITFLKQLIEVIRVHSHPFPMDPPSFTDAQTKVLNKDLDQMLSQSVRTN